MRYREAERMFLLTDYLESLERQLFDVGTRSSPARAGDLLAADFREFGKSGRAWTRADIIAAMAAEARQMDYELADFAVRNLGDDFALVTYSVQIERPDGHDKALRSSIWQREADEKWRMLFHQGTASRRTTA